jgi:HAD superfamily hydrolase (TIGR01490 family)
VNIAFFDFDGTVTDSDSFSPFVRFAAPLRTRLAGYVWLSPRIAGYWLGHVKATDMRQRLCRFAFRGRLASEVAALGARYAEEILPGKLRPEAMARLAWHERQGDVIVVVSASLEPYLAPWCAARNLGLICTRLEAKDGVLTGRFLGGDCSGSEKARRIVAAHSLDAFDAVYAYGDTHEDLDMLALASHRYFRWQEQAAD